jgi:hypothetical protein
MVLWALVLIGVIGMPAITAYGLYRWSRGFGIGFAVLWGGWIVAGTVLADHDVFRQSAITTQPWVAVAAGAALLVGVVGGTRVNAPLPALVWPHVLRVVGAVFLIAMAMGKLPAVFALPAGLGDVAVGISAPFIARRLARGDRTGAVWFNVLGLLDLVVAVSLGFLAGLGPVRVIDVSPSTADVAVLPLVLVPVVAVPLAMALHIRTLVRLRRAPATGLAHGLTGRRESTPVP